MPAQCSTPTYDLGVCAERVVGLRLAVLVGQNSWKLVDGLSRTLQGAPF